jgi:hypothetical protein
MRRIMIVALSAALLTTTAWVVHGAAGSTGTVGSNPSADANPGPPTDNRTLEHGLRMAKLAPLADQLARARLATAKYATSLRAAKTDGYQIITRMIPDMGWHFLNPTIQGFDVRQPPILIYERHGNSWQLAAFEWVFLPKPATPPLPGATYGSFGAARHYKDGTFVFARTQELCAKRSPETGGWRPRSGVNGVGRRLLGEVTQRP